MIWIHCSSKMIKSCGEEIGDGSLSCSIRRQSSVFRSPRPFSLYNSLRSLRSLRFKKKHPAFLLHIHSLCEILCVLCDLCGEKTHPTSVIRFALSQETYHINRNRFNNKITGWSKSLQKLQKRFLLKGERKRNCFSFFLSF